ncbi:MAG: ABC transporter permease [Candidatus Sericytochromatia bacterium]
MKPRTRKLLSALLTILAATLLSFVLIRAMPGDFLDMRATELVEQQGLPYATAYRIASSQYNYDPNLPLWQQFVTYFGGLLQGNLGTSMTLRIPVSTVLLQALPWTLFLNFLALIMSFSVGSTLGLILAWKRRSRILAPFLNGLAVVSQAVPDFLIGLLLLVFLGVRLRWFPLRGAYDISVVPGANLAFVLSVLQHALLPALAYTLSSIGGWMLAMRASATQVLNEDFLLVAQAKGLRQNRIFGRYLARNAIMPPITQLAIAFASMISGSIFVEWMFAYPGIGYFFGYALGNRDFTLLQGILLVSTITMVVANLLADVVYSWIDPRVKT